MTFIEIVQMLHREARLPGTAPAAVDSQTGMALDLVEWVRQAYNDIQRMHNGRWRWLHGYAQAAMPAAAESFSYDDTTTTVTDVDSMSAITRWRGWIWNDQQDLPKVWVDADGEASEQFMVPIDFRSFRAMWRFQTAETGNRPTHITEQRDRKILVAPIPTVACTIELPYWKGQQSLATADEVPEMPVDYHPMIAFWALSKYGLSNVAPELIARAGTEVTSYLNDLEQYESMAMTDWTLAAPLA